MDKRERDLKSKQLTLSQRNGILQTLLQFKKGEKLQRNAIKTVAAKFEVSRLTVSKIWHIAENQFNEGKISADVTHRWGIIAPRCGAQRLLKAQRHSGKGR